MWISVLNWLDKTKTCWDHDYNHTYTKHPLTEALGQVGLLVDEDLGGDDGAEGLEGGDQVRVGELLRQVVDEEVVGAVPARPRPLLHAAAVRGLQLAACNIAGLHI